MKLYVVTKEGVYRHEILGIYTKIDLAQKRVEEVDKLGDGYHSIEIGTCNINEPIEDIESQRESTIMDELKKL